MRRFLITAPLGFSAALLLIATQLLTHSASAPNQTNGFGNGKLVTFTYLQSFDCVDQPKLDLGFNGIKAQSDPNEMQTPDLSTNHGTYARSDRRYHSTHGISLGASSNVSVNHDRNPADAMAVRELAASTSLLDPNTHRALVPTKPIESAIRKLAKSNR